jgi:hypothetical protein
MLGNKEKGPDPKIGATSVSLSQVLAGRRKYKWPGRENVGAPTFKVKL